MKEIKTDHYINVAKLRELLADAPDDALVVMSKDGEGNGFSPFADLSPARYEAETSWSGDILDEDEASGDEGTACIVLWPVN